MITNHILEDKWRVQRALTEQAGHDPSEYIALTHTRAVETQVRYGVQFKYAEVEEAATPPSPKRA